MKKLSMKVLDQNVLDKKNIGITTLNLNNYFDRKDGEAFARIVVTEDGKQKHFYLARRKYIPRVTKFLQANGDSSPMILSREEANKTIAKQYAIKFEVSEVADE